MIEFASVFVRFVCFAGRQIFWKSMVFVQLDLVEFDPYSTQSRCSPRGCSDSVIELACGSGEPFVDVVFRRYCSGILINVGSREYVANWRCSLLVVFACSNSPYSLLFLSLLVLHLFTLCAVLLHLSLVGTVVVR